MTAAARLRRDVIVPAVVLAELYRGPHRDQLVDACLSHETGVTVRSPDRRLARLVGGVLAAADADATMIVDAHVVAATVEFGRGVILTCDPGDIERLAAPYPTISVIDIVCATESITLSVRQLVSSMTSPSTLPVPARTA